MVNVISGVTNAENGVYILWGIAILGLVLKIISNTYIKMFMRKTENMAMTKKKKLRIMRQKYENRRSLGMEGDSADFVEKNIRNFRFLGLPFEAFCRHINIGVYVLVMVSAGAFLLYEPSWRGSPGMVTFLANSVIVCAFLMSLENIFLTRTKLEIMKANIRDYLDNMPVRGADNTDSMVRRPSSKPIRTQEAHNAELPADAGGRYNGVHKSCDKGNRIRDEAVLAEAEAAVTEGMSLVTEMTGKMCGQSEAAVNAVRCEKPPDPDDINNEISLDGFLKEFFS